MKLSKKIIIKTLMKQVYFALIFLSDTALLSSVSNETIKTYGHLHHGRC